VGVGYFADETAHLGDARVKGSAQVYLGTGCDVVNATIDVIGGALEINSSLASAIVNVQGGSLTIGESSAGTVSAANVWGGTLFHRSNMTVTTARVGAGTLNFDGNSGSIGCTNCTCTKGATVIDTFQRVSWTADIILEECGLEDVTLQLGKDITVRRV